MAHNRTGAALVQRASDGVGRCLSPGSVYYQPCCCVSVGQPSLMSWYHLSWGGPYSSFLARSLLLRTFLRSFLLLLECSYGIFHQFGPTSYLLKHPFIESFGAQGNSVLL